MNLIKLGANGAEIVKTLSADENGVAVFEVVAPSQANGEKLQYQAYYYDANNIKSQDSATLNYLPDLSFNALHIKTNDDGSVAVVISDESTQRVQLVLNLQGEKNPAVLELVKTETGFKFNTGAITGGSGKSIDNAFTRSGLSDSNIKASNDGVVLEIPANKVASGSIMARAYDDVGNYNISQGVVKADASEPSTTPATSEQLKSIDLAGVNASLGEHKVSHIEIGDGISIKQLNVADVVQVANANSVLAIDGGHGGHVELSTRSGTRLRAITQNIKLFMITLLLL